MDTTSDATKSKAQADYDAILQVHGRRVANRWAYFELKAAHRKASGISDAEFHDIWPAADTRDIEELNQDLWGDEALLPEHERCKTGLVKTFGITGPTADFDELGVFYASEDICMQIIENMQADFKAILDSVKPRSSEQ
ncbi:hypothetical protein [Caballeronia sp. DA-9]|uniref:hypothetical protein n=1 Tax=Caballeronia sp. DA-9 TaxID=3436237 RepID=UPI003F67D17A